MALFRCFIRGDNFPGELIGTQGLVGFYTTRWVEAASKEEAERSALELLRSEPTFRIEGPRLREQARVDAKVHFEEIVEVEQSTDRTPNSGATWFEMT